VHSFSVEEMDEARRSVRAQLQTPRTVSAWMTSAAREALLRRAGLAAVAEWEKQHGPFSAEEMDEARRSVRAQLRTPRTFRRPV
jgi:hypothetical protein